MRAIARLDSEERMCPILQKVFLELICVRDSVCLSGNVRRINVHVKVVPATWVLLRKPFDFGLLEYPDALLR